MTLCLFLMACAVVAGGCLLYLWNARIEIPGVKELVAERDLYKDASSDLLIACELFERWMLGGQPGPYSDSQILEIVQRAIAKAKSSESSKR